MVTVFGQDEEDDEDDYDDIDDDVSIESDEDLRREEEEGVTRSHRGGIGTLELENLPGGETGAMARRRQKELLPGSRASIPEQAPPVMRTSKNRQLTKAPYRDDEEAGELAKDNGLV